MDRITLTGVEVWAHHGVLPHEAEIGQRFLVDLAVGIDPPAAARADELAATVDYGALASLVARQATEPRSRLIEVVAERVAAAVVDLDDRVAEVTVTVHKPNAPMPVAVADVAVTVHRRRRDATAPREG